MRALTFFAAVFGLTACTTEVNLGSHTSTPLVAPAQPRVALTGEVCLPVVVSPIRLVVALDASQSMALADPNGSRATALRQFLDGLPQDPAVGVAVLLFGGSSVTWLTRNGLAGFDRLTDLDAAARTQLTQRVLAFTASNSTEFLAPLDAIYGLLSRDLAQHTGLAETRPRYEVIFLSDAHPTTSQDDALFCSDAVRRVRMLRDLTEEVTVHTVHVFSPSLPSCTGDAGLIVDPACGFAELPAGTCSALIVAQDARRLARMAELGGGTFHEFRDGAPVTFDLTFAPVQRRLVLGQLVASNLSTPAGSAAGQVDSDLDRLLDADEQREGTAVTVADTDGDGFTDGVEVYGREHGGSFDPLRADLGCPAEFHGLDTDCDGLVDCDEQLIGSSVNVVDSDADGVPDVVEFQLGSQPARRDLGEDPDTDALTTGAELAAHLAPQRFDASPPTNDYRTSVSQRATRETDGSQCWDFSITNVALATPVIGLNELFVSYAMIWEDLPDGHTFVRTARRQTASTDQVFARGDFAVCR